MRESIKEAKNVDEAIELACAELGVERDVTEFEIISLPKRGFLGLRNSPAKVRVYIEEAEPRKPSPAPAKKPQPAEGARQTTSNPAAPARPEFPRRPDERSEARPPVPTIPPPERPRAVDSPAQPPRENFPTTPLPPLEFKSLEDTQGKARVAADYLKEVLGGMGVDAGITVAYSQSGGAVLRLSGEGLGVIIGRRGETLDSLQYLVGLVGNRGDGDYMRITIDSGNYREKRERTLVALAQKLSSSAIKYGRASTLEPMNPYERRIIHATVSSIDGVSSSSIGEDPNRRVVISPTGARPPQQFNERDNPRRAGRPNTNRGPRPAGGRPPYRDRPERPAGAAPREVARGANELPRPEPGRPNVPMTDELRREFRPRSEAPRTEFRSRPDARGEFGAGGRPPRHDFRVPNREPSQPVTPTSLDREYAKEIEQGRPVVSAETVEKPVTKENAAPAQPLREGKDLPLYGKIDI